MGVVRRRGNVLSYHGGYERGADVPTLKWMPALPLINDISQIFWYVISYPGHKFAIKPEIWAALMKHETANV